MNNIKSNTTEQKDNNLINSQPRINIGNFDNLDNLEFLNTAQFDFPNFDQLQT